MIQRLSDMLRHPDATIRRQGVELAESLAEAPENHAMLCEAKLDASRIPTGVVAALMLRLPRGVLSTAPGRSLMLKLPFNLPELALLADRPRLGGLHIVEAEPSALPPITFPAHLTGLTLYCLRSASLLEAVVASELPALTELNLDQLDDAVELSGLGLLSTLHSLAIQSAPGVLLTVLPPTLRCLRLERVRLAPDALSLARGLTELSVVDCGVDGLLDLPSPGALRRIRLEGMALTAIPAGLLAQPDLTSLSLCRNGLLALPESIWTMAWLEELQVSDNRLFILPQSIGQLTALRCLDLSSNQLTTLPDSIRGLTALEELMLQDNPLSTLPDAVGALRSLKKLWLGRTGLTALPPCLFDLPQLEELELRGLQIRQFPPPEAFPMLRRVRIDRAREGAARQWSRQRIRAGRAPLLVQ
ncbi:MAG: leucine-rich repeat domain-containing protein [Myxococcota bacterium]|nr:leucine-rich repeat domain-containing protein [Myxococcota bacterium]